MSSDQTVRPIEDKTTVIKNPAMGWVLYIEEFEHPFPEAAHYWMQVADGVEYASILYIRIPWSRMEPFEGKYAWKEDENYKKVIQMGLERGLKLAFRIFIDSQDAHMQATPEFVFSAGCKGYQTRSNKQYQTPYVTDKIFREKFENFIRAFSKQYDDPEMVDFVDAQGLGWWGEMHNLDDLLPWQKKNTFEWITHLYCTNFTKVILGGQYGRGSFSKKIQDWALSEEGYVIRRDSLGSPVWFKEKDKQEILDHWPYVPVFAENCFHHLQERSEWWKEVGYRNYRDMMQGVLRDAYDIHANTLDLRIPQDVNTWLTHAPDLVREFSIMCGYRFVLTEIIFPNQLIEEQSFQIHHTWKNTGVGILPNQLLNWNHKYKLSFALLDQKSDEPIWSAYSFVEVADWIQGELFNYSEIFWMNNVESGCYDLAVAIVNKEQRNEPAIKIAIQNKQVGEGWYLLGNVGIGK